MSKRESLGKTQMTLPKELENKRDELLVKMRDQGSNYEERAHAREGFNAAVELMQVDLYRTEMELKRTKEKLQAKEEQYRELVALANDVQCDLECRTFEDKVVIHSVHCLREDFQKALKKFGRAK